MDGPAKPGHDKVKRRADARRMDGPVKPGHDKVTIWIAYD